MLQLEQVLAAVQRRQRHMGRPGEYGEMDEVGVKVQDVEAMRQALDLLEHGHMIGNVVPNCRVEAKRLLAAWYEGGGCVGVAACEQRDIVTLADQFVGEVGDHPFRAAI
jgi:hypothetical protein